MTVAWKLAMGKSDKDKPKEVPAKPTKKSKTINKVARNGTATAKKVANDNGNSTANNSTNGKEQPTSKVETTDGNAAPGPTPTNANSPKVEPPKIAPLQKVCMVDAPGKAVAVITTKQEPTTEASKDDTASYNASTVNDGPSLPNANQAPKNVASKGSTSFSKRGHFMRRLSRSVGRNVSENKGNTNNGNISGAYLIEPLTEDRANNEHVKTVSDTPADPGTDGAKNTAPTSEPQPETVAKAVLLLGTPSSNGDAEPATKPTNAEVGSSRDIKRGSAEVCPSNTTTTPTQPIRSLATTRDILLAASLSRQGSILPIASYPKLSMSTPLTEEKLKLDERSHVKRLFRAVGNEDVTTIVSLLASGLVSPDVVSAGGITPLVYAAARGLFDSTEALIMHSADLNRMSEASFAAFKPTQVASASKLEDGMQTSEPRTALMTAAEHGRLRVAELLLLAGADDGIIAPDGQIALRLAALNGHHDIAEMLPERNDGAAERIAYKLAPARSHMRNAVLCIQIVWFITVFISAWVWGLMLKACKLEESWARFCASVKADLILIQDGWKWTKDKFMAGIEWFLAYWPLLIAYGEDVV